MEFVRRMFRALMGHAQKHGFPHQETLSRPAMTESSLTHIDHGA
jgi:hypothetical protein